MHQIDRLRKSSCFWLFLITIMFGPSVLRADALSAAVVLTYHRFGEETFPSTNTSLEQLEAQIAALQAAGRPILPLDDIVDALIEGRSLPDGATAISIDDAYLSAYEEAWPRLREAGFPVTLFVATEALDLNRPGYMTWDQLREMQAAGVTVGSQTVTHPHMPTLSTARNAEELRQSAARLESELGVRPTLFAYPYGEASSEIMEQVAEAGYRAAFGQHSGVANAADNVFYLPRFPINETYGTPDRFADRISMLPFPTQGLVPKDPLLPAEGPGNPPSFGFTLKDVPEPASTVACYHSDPNSTLTLNQLGDRIEVRFTAPFPPGRTRINCTLRVPDGRYRWFGMQYYTPRP